MDLLVREMGAGQAVKVGPKTPNLPYSGHGRLLLGCTCHAPKHKFLLGFSHIGTPGTPQEVTIDHFGPIMSARPQLTLRIGSNLRPCKLSLEVDVPTSNLQSEARPTFDVTHKVPRIMRAKAK